MADHYFAVTGSGSGTGADANNPQTYSGTALNTAEAAASSGDTIFFLPGSYGAAPTVFDAPIGVTYQSTETHGAEFSTTSAGQVITLGTTSTYDIGLIGFKFSNYGIYATAAANNTPNTVKNNLFLITTGSNFGNTGAIRGHNFNSNCPTNFTDNVFKVKIDNGTRLLRNVSPWAFERNTFDITTVNVSSSSLGVEGGMPSNMKNNIWQSNDASVFATTVALNANSTYSCFYQMGSHNAATGTNIEADPQFVDSANADFHLRPTSPCIGAGTSS